MEMYNKACVANAQAGVEVSEVELARTLVESFV